MAATAGALSPADAGVDEDRHDVVAPLDELALLPELDGRVEEVAGVDGCRAADDRAAVLLHAASTTALAATASSAAHRVRRRVLGTVVTPGWERGRRGVCIPGRRYPASPGCQRHGTEPAGTDASRHPR
jgi:hypothetical protein